jgi:hypothetical protein
MGHERLKHLKNCLLCCIESQMNNLDEVDAAELGEAIDMLKDLEEAIYYTTITEAMTEKDDKKHTSKEHDWDNYHQEKMYYSSAMPSAMDMDDNGHMLHDNKADHSAHDAKEGRSPASRRMYMETKMTSTDKATQLRELEKYMQELTNDIVEMIQDASPEEKSYLEKKMTTLAAKVGQMK